MLYPLQRGAGYPLSALELPCLSPLETPAGDPEGIHLPSYFQGRGQLREKPGWIPAALSLGSFAGIWPGRREISRVEPAHPQLNRNLTKASEASWSSLPRRLLAALGPALPLQAPAAMEASRCWPGALALTWQEWEAPIGRFSGPQSSAPLGRCSQRRIAGRRDPLM